MPTVKSLRSRAIEWEKSNRKRRNRRRRWLRWERRRRRTWGSSSGGVARLKVAERKRKRSWWCRGGAWMRRKWIAIGECWETLLSDLICVVLFNVSVETWEGSGRVLQFAEPSQSEWLEWSFSGVLLLFVLIIIHKCLYLWN